MVLVEGQGADTESLTMKKLCYLINTDWYFELHWLERAIAAQKSGFEVHLVTHFEGDKVREKLSAAGVFCHDIPLSAQSYNPASLLFSYFKISSLLKRINPDILHCITIKASLIGGIYSRSEHKKTVLSFVGLGRVFSFNKAPLSYLRYCIIEFYKLIFRNKNVKLLFEHEEDRRELIKFTRVSPDKTLVINGAGVNTDLFCYKNEKPHPVPVILFASRLLWSKGLTDLIKVKEQLQNEGILCRIDVAGIITSKDADAIPLVKVKEWHDQGKINWLGQSDNVAALIAESNLVVLPSVYPEGIPRILLESSASGRASIAYNSGGCGSLIKDGLNGYLVEKGDVDTLKERIKILLENPLLRAEMGRQGRSVILSEFSSELVTKKTLELYNHFFCSDM